MMNLDAMRRLAVCLLLLIASPALAQKIDRDARPLTGTPADQIPVYRSVADFAAHSDGRPLSDYLTPVDRARVSPLTVGTRIQRTPGTSSTRATGRLDLQRLRLRRAENGTVRWLQGTLDPKGQISASKHQSLAVVADAALGVATQHAALLRLDDPASELRSTAVRQDALGFSHARFEQVYQGIPVWGRDLYVHFDAAGRPYALNGTYEPTPRGVTTTPALSADAAETAVVRDLQVEGRWAPVAPDAARQLGLDRIERRLVLYPDEAGRVHLAYEVSLHPNLLEWFTYLVDARSGAVLTRIERHCTLRHTEAAPKAPRVTRLVAPPSTGGVARGEFFDASGTDLNNATGTFRVYQHDNGTYYKVSDLDNIDLDKLSLPDIPTDGGAVTLDANTNDLTQDTELFFLTSTNNSWSDPAGVSAHVNMRIAYRYYKDTYNRQAINDLNESLISIIHVTEDGQAMDNAYWNGRIMAYGDGAEVFTPLAGALDVAGHEMTHGVIQHTANLVYQFQPGALNESFADVFGVMVDREDFFLGEDIMRPNQGIALRDLQNPDNANVLSQQPAHMDQFQDLPADRDNGGVHINSGIPNRAAYLVIDALGHERAEQIYYRALSTYLTRSSEFADARNAIEQAARDLYTDTEAAAIRSAFDAVGIGGGGGSDPDDDDVPPATGGTEVLAFLLDDGRIGYYDVAQDAAFVYNATAAVARVSSGGDRAQLSTPLDGTSIWFINGEGKLASINTATGDVGVVNGLQLQQEGDLWNASISPNQNLVALVSAYEDDPNVYLYDGQNIGRIEIAPESSQDGINVETVLYPDVISWSPNTRDPRLGLDALNRVGGGIANAINPVTFWTLYEIDLANVQVFSLLASQPDEVSVGNITYSNTDPDLIAFNFVGEDGVWDTYLGNFETGDLIPLDISSFTIENQAIEDGARPTFSPNDQFVGFGSAANNALLFYNIGTEELFFRRFDATVYNPRWFLRGGQVPSDVEEAELPEQTRLASNYPNPFNPATVLRVELAEAGPVQLEVFDLLGRHVSSLVNGVMAAGTHDVRFAATDLPSGTYLARLRAGGRTHVHSMVLLR